MVILVRRAPAAFERSIEDFERLDFGDVEQAPADGLASRRWRAFELKHEQAILAVLLAVIVRLGDARPAFIANLDKALVRDRQPDSCIDRRRRVDEVQHLLE